MGMPGMRRQQVALHSGQWCVMLLAQTSKVAGYSFTKSAYLVELRSECPKHVYHAHMNNKKNDSYLILTPIAIRFCWIFSLLNFTFCRQEATLVPKGWCGHPLNKVWKSGSFIALNFASHLDCCIEALWCDTLALLDDARALL